LDYTEVSMAHKKILVVDDEKKIVDIVKAYLEKEG
jgi:DNA-binding response OmpR family regulator